MKSLSFSAVMLASSLSLLGCVGDEAATDGTDPTTEDGADALGEVKQEVAAYGLWNYGCTSAFCNYDIGTQTGRTCFLGGVSGDLRDGYAIVSRLNGRFRLELRAATNKTVGATAICISGNTNLTTASWKAGLPAKQILGTVTSTRRCFLSGLFNANAVDGFDNAGDFAEVWKDTNGNWWLGGNQAGGGDPNAYATCVDIPASAGVWGIVAPSSGTASFNMASNPGGIACGLTKAGGPLTGGGSDGVNIAYNSGTHFWTFTASNSKQGQALCFQ